MIIARFSRPTPRFHGDDSMKPRLSAIALATVAAFGLVALRQGRAPKPAAKAEAARRRRPPTLTVKIGHVGPLTGGIAHLGKDNENGARLAVEEANAAKIKIDGKEVKFVLVAEDDQADPKVGTTVAQKLVDAKVAGVVGHLNSGTSIPASPIYSQAGIPVISGSATNPKLTEQGFKTQFRVVGRDDQQGPAIASYLAANNKPKTVAVIDDATAYGEGIANEVEKTLKAARHQRAAAREGHRQDHRLEGDPHQAARAQPRRGVLRRHGRHRRPAAEAGARARHQGGVRVRRRRVHRRDGEARRRGGRRAAVLAGRHPGRRPRARSSSTPTRRSSTSTRSCTRRSPTTPPTC